MKGGGVGGGGRDGKALRSRRGERRLSAGSATGPSRGRADFIPCSSAAEQGPSPPAQRGHRSEPSAANASARPPVQRAGALRVTVGRRVHPCALSCSAAGTDRERTGPRPCVGARLPIGAGDFDFDQPRRRMPGQNRRGWSRWHDRAGRMVGARPVRPGRIRPRTAPADACRLPHRQRPGSSGFPHSDSLPPPQINLYLQCSMLDSC